AEALEVVGGVVPDLRVGLRAATDDEATLAPVVQTRGFDGVLAVVAGLLLRQEALVVAEVLAVVRAVVGGGAGEDVLDLVPSLFRQGVHGAFGTSSAIRARGLLGGIRGLPGLGVAALPAAGVVVAAEAAELARPGQ